MGSNVIFLFFKGDEHFLPSIGTNHNSSVDFIPLCDQPSSSNALNNNIVIGPTLPPDLNLPSNGGGQQGGGGGFPNINGFILKFSCRAGERI